MVVLNAVLRSVMLAYTLILLNTVSIKFCDFVMIEMCCLQ
jgi:hypothetical protein